MPAVGGGGPFLETEEPTITYVSSSEEDASTLYGSHYPVEGSNHNNQSLHIEQRSHHNRSIHLKSTNATLAETFSEQHSYDFVDAAVGSDEGTNTFDSSAAESSQQQYYVNTNELGYYDSEEEADEEGEAQNMPQISQNHLIAGGLEYVDSEEEEYAAVDQNQNQNQYTDDDPNGQYYKDVNGLEYADSCDSQEQHDGFEYGGNDGNDTLEYTDGGDMKFGQQQGTFSARAMHTRTIGDFHNTAPHLEETETSVGYETYDSRTYDSRTLNTNQEGLIFEQEMETHCEEQGEGHVDPHLGYYYENGQEYYVPAEDEEAMQHYPHNSMEQQPSAVFELSASRTHSNAGTAMSKHATSRAIHDEYSDVSGPPMESYDPEEEASWEEGSACDASRDISLLDSADSQDLDTFDHDADDDDSSCSSDDSDDDRRARRRRSRSRSRPRSMMDLITHMKNCALKGASTSYDDTDFQILPDVGHAATNSSSRTSFSGSRAGGRSNRNRRRRKDRDDNSIFSTMSSVIAEEFSRHQQRGGGGGKKKKQQQRRRGGRQPASVRLVESIVDIFGCGAPTNY